MSKVFSTTKLKPVLRADHILLSREKELRNLCLGGDKFITKILSLILTFPDAVISINAVGLKSGRTALHWAYKGGNAKELIPILIEHGANEFIKDHEGLVPKELEIKTEEESLPVEDPIKNLESFIKEGNFNAAKDTIEKYKLCPNIILQEEKLSILSYIVKKDFAPSVELNDLILFLIQRGAILDFTIRSGISKKIYEWAKKHDNLKVVNYIFTQSFHLNLNKLTDFNKRWEQFTKPWECPISLEITPLINILEIEPNNFISTNSFFNILTQKKLKNNIVKGAKTDDEAKDALLAGLQTERLKFENPYNRNKISLAHASKFDAANALRMHDVEEMILANKFRTQINELKDVSEEVDSLMQDYLDFLKDTGRYFNIPGTKKAVLKLTDKSEQEILQSSILSINKFKKEIFNDFVSISGTITKLLNAGPQELPRIEI